MKALTAEKLAQWQCKKIMLCDLGKRIYEVLNDLSATFCHFIVLREDASRAVAIISTEEFVELIEKLRQSRFPGDLVPTELTMSQLMKTQSYFDFYMLDLPASALSTFTCFRNLPPRHTLVCENGEPRAVLSRVDFRDWVSSLEPLPPMAHKNPLV